MLQAMERRRMQTKHILGQFLSLFFGVLLRKNEEDSGKKVLTQICLICSTENTAEESVCRKCGQPLGTPQLSRRRNTLQIVAMFAIFTALVSVLVILLIFAIYYLFK